MFSFSRCLLISQQITRESAVVCQAVLAAIAKDFRARTGRHDKRDAAEQGRHGPWYPDYTYPAGRSARRRSV